MGLYKDRQIFDPADMAESDKIGSYLIGEGGLVVDSETISGNEALMVSVKNTVDIDDAAIIAELQDIEADVEAVNTSLGTVNSNLDSIELKLDDVNLELDSIDDHLANLEYQKGDVGGATDYGIQPLGVANNTAPTVVEGQLAGLNFNLSSNLRVIDNTMGQLVKTEDAAHVSGDKGIQMLSVRRDTLSALTSADGDYAPLATNDSNELYVHDVDANASLDSIETKLDTIIGHVDGLETLIGTTNSTLATIDTSLNNIESDIGLIEGYFFAEDTAHVSGDKGIMAYGVRQDASGSPVSADGDIHPFIFNSDGELKVAADLSSDIADDAADSGNPVKIGGRGFDGALTALSASNDRFDMLGDMYRRIWVNNSPNVGFKNSNESVAATAGEVLATPLAGRIKILAQNLGSGDVYIGHNASVTTSNGFRVAKGSTVELPFGEDLNIFAISASGTNDVRFLELA